MAVVEDTVDIPDAISEGAQQAAELHARLFPKAETPAEEPAGEEEKVVEEQPAEEPEEASVEEPVDEDESYRKKYEILEGKYKAEVPRMAAELKEMREMLKAMQTPAEEKAPEVPKQKQEMQEILERLTAEYPEELIDNLVALQRLQAEEAAERLMKPVADKTQSYEDQQYAIAQQTFVEMLDSKSDKWRDIWNVANELAEGETPSDPKIAQFLMSPDPSGLYRNLDLIHEYNNRWDGERLATLCNMYGAETKKVPPTQRPDAMLAPSRVKSQPIHQPEEKKIWTMTEFHQFQRDAHNGVYDDATKEALWTDIQTALAEGRIRG